MLDDKFNNFLRSFGAARKLLQRAHDEQFLIEGVVLYASLTDGLLRIALVLKDQISNKNIHIDPAFISQDSSDFYSERKIYKMAYDGKIIDVELFEMLNELYNERNNIIHKFFLTGIEYKDLPDICISYEHVYQALYKTVYDLEEEQIKQGVGMTVKGEKVTAEEERQILKDVLLKIDSTVNVEDKNTKD